MERFYYEEPSIERKEEAIEYINEHIKYGSKINGTGKLDDYLETKNYEQWLEFLELLKNKEEAYKNNFVPARTYFLIRENDNRIVGMINIRLELNDFLKEHGGHIGYGIRPTERRKGYNKINLYLGLQVCDRYGISEALLDANIDNQASWKTMEALGGIRVKQFFDEKYNFEVVDYIINVKESLEKYKDIYEPCIVKEKIR